MGRILKMTRQWAAPCDVCDCLVSDIAVFVLKRDVKLQPTVLWRPLLQHRSRVVASNANWSSGEVRWQRGCSSCEGAVKPGAAHHGARCTQQCAVGVAGGRRGQDLAMTTHDAQRRQQAASSDAELV